MRRIAFLSLASGFAAAVAVACGGGGDSPPGGGGLVFPDGGGFMPDSGADASACPPAPTQVLEVSADCLDVSGDEVVFVDLEGGVDFINTSKTRSVRKVKLDGTGDTVLYAAAASHQINDAKTVGGTVYFLESERNEFGSEGTRVFSIPLAGGTPTLIGKHDDPAFTSDFDRLDSIVSVDAGGVYVVRGAASGEGSLFRMALADGVETLVYRGAINSRPQRVGDEFVFASGSIVSGVQNYTTVAKVPAAGGTPVALGGAKCRNDVTAGDWGVLCSGSSETMHSRKLSKWDLSGGGHTVVLDLSEKGSAILNIGPSDGASVWIQPNTTLGSNNHVLKASLAGGASSIVACDRQRITRRKSVAGASNGAYVSELNMAVTPTEIVWFEEREDADVKKSAIYRTPR